MARCGCGTGDGTEIINGPNTVVTGTGTTANPYVIASHTDCAEARACFSGTGGVNVDTSTGVISADISGDAGNTLALGGDGGLFVPTGTATIATGPGITGDGSLGNPARANVFAWGFPGTVDAGGSQINVDSSGRLRGEPGYHSYYRESRTNRIFGPGIPVPAGALTNVDVPFVFNVTNPDPYRFVNVVDIQEFDAYLNLPINGAGASGWNGEETYKMENTGNGPVINVHSSTTRTFFAGALAPGTSMNLSMQPQLGEGANGAECVRMVMSHRVMLLPF